MIVRFRGSFEKDLARIGDKAVLRRVKELVEQVETAQGLRDISGVKKLQGPDDYFRIRVGEFRVGVVVEGKAVVFVRCLQRKEIYRFFP